MPEIRIPTQQRSIEKRQRIIAKGFELICKQGYYNTTTNDIAKYAKVSIGIIYQYFADKKDIFMAGIKESFDKLYRPIEETLGGVRITRDNIYTILDDLLSRLILGHEIDKSIHEEISAMSHLDEDINDLFKNIEIQATEVIMKIFAANEINPENPYEVIHIIYGLVANYSHESVYHRHKQIDYTVLKDKVIKIIINLVYA